VVFVGALLAATTGIVGATVVAMGLISLPAMLRNNYANPLSTGTIAASGTLGQIIPPSIVLIILADQLASATDQASHRAQGAAQGSHRRADHAVGIRVSSAPARARCSSAPSCPASCWWALHAFILAVALIRPKLAPAVPLRRQV
jgi:TRAP-type mannitol/chloroaromatic compound transport system permease large subunit